MKTIRKILFLILVGSLLSIICFASSKDSQTFYYENGKEITVCNSALSYEEKQQIADYFAYNDFSNRSYPIEENIKSSILCTLFGHSLSTTYVYEVEHNVYTTSPKCVRNNYKSEYCTRSSCDYIETTLISSVRISTCHG